MYIQEKNVSVISRTVACEAEAEKEVATLKRSERYHCLFGRN